MFDFNYLFLLGLISGVAISVPVAAIEGAIISWLILKRESERTEAAKLRDELRELTLSRRQWQDGVNLTARQGIANILTLNKAALHDLLDSTYQLDPEEAVDALRGTELLETIKVLLETGNLK